MSTAPIRCFGGGTSSCDCRKAHCSIDGCQAESTDVLPIQMLKTLKAISTIECFTRFCTRLSWSIECSDVAASLAPLSSQGQSRGIIVCHGGGPHQSSASSAVGPRMPMCICSAPIGSIRWHETPTLYPNDTSMCPPLIPLNAMTFALSLCYPSR